MTFIEQIKQADLLVQGGFVAITGLVIVFLVLGLFFLTIKIMQKIDRGEDTKETN
ncbi:MAG: OadG family protein [Clostridia bacterium]|nr:OadG family protein [Clostridia bacterium]